jgi:predicted SnoaL-like aldol condensation-catalyzing enzyme
MGSVPIASDKRMERMTMINEATHKLKVMKLFSALRGQVDLSSLESLVAASYIPHTAALNDVVRLQPGFGALKARLMQRGRIPHEVKRIIADGDYVYAQVRYDGAMPVAGADIFRFDEAGQIAEHWNSRQRLPNDLARGVDRFAGGGDASLTMTPERRIEMKRIMTDILLEMWGKGRRELVPLYYDESYVQHNPDMPGGYHRIKEVVETEIQKYIAATGGPFPVDVHLMGAEGDLIFVYYSVFMAGINRAAGARSTNTDVFRIDANNRMIEHWDVLQIEGEPLPDDSTLF